MGSFWQSKTKVRKSDQIFSMYIRCRDGDCVYKKKCMGHIPFKELTNSHYYSRKYEGVRYDPQNCDSACRKCHNWTETTDEGQAWLSGFKQAQLGNNAMNILAMRKGGGHKHTPLDEIAAIAYAKELLKQLTPQQRAFAKTAWNRIIA